MPNTVKLVDIAHTIRSKNAGAHHYTFDVMFTDRDVYEKVKHAGALNREVVAERYDVPVERVTHFFAYDPGLAFKIAIRRPVTSGTIGETDVYGSQQYVPLLGIEIPWEEQG